MKEIEQNKKKGNPKNQNNKNEKMLIKIKNKK